MGCKTAPSTPRQHRLSATGMSGRRRPAAPLWTALALLQCLPAAYPQAREPPRRTPECAVEGGGAHELACGSGAHAACVLGGRYRFPAAAIEQRGDVNDNPMVRGGEGLGKLVAPAEDVGEGAPVFLKCSPPADGRGTVCCTLPRPVV